MRAVISGALVIDLAPWSKRASSLLDLVCMWSAGLLFMVNVGDILMGVFARYLFQSSPIWTEELARYTLVWMVMLAAPPALKRGEHMGIDLVVQYFPLRMQTMIQWLSRSLFVAITLFMTIMGWRYAWSVSAFTTMGLGIPKTVPMLAVPVGMLLLLIQHLLLLLSTPWARTKTLAGENP